MIIPQILTTKNSSPETTGPGADLYNSYIAGHEGVRHRSRLSPAGLRDGQVNGTSALVLKPDGGQFAAAYPRVGPGSRKGDVEPRRACLLRLLLRHFPRAQILGSGGSDASFHVVLPLDPQDQSKLGTDRERVLTLLEKLRVMAFCDQIGHGLNGALSARTIGSINSKTGALVVEIQPATGVYTLRELEELTDAWFNSPEVSLFRAWFGVGGEEEQVRCPFHDSADPDLKVSDKLFCFGANHCAADSRAAIFHMVPGRKKDKAPTLSVLLLADTAYRERWAQAFSKLHREYQDHRDRQMASQRAAAAGKQLISIQLETTDDQILDGIRSAFATLSNLYCDATGRLITLEPDRQTGELQLVHHDSVDRFISLVDRAAIVRTPAGKDSWACRPLPHDRAVAVFHRPELRDGMRVLARVSKTPVLDRASVRVQPPGYDSSTHVYYDGPVIETPDHGRTPRLDELLSGWTGFCGSVHRSCRSDSDIAHIYAAVFTEILADSGLFTLHRHSVMKANQKGAGKDKVAEILGILRDNKTPEDLNHYDENRINQGFGNGIHAGGRIFQVTNIVCAGAYSNPMLTRWFTSESLTGPKHGGGTWSINPNTVTVVFTINRGSIDLDLLDRLLLINLEVTGDARKRTFGLDPVQFAREHRLEIAGEVLGLALTCLREGRVWEIPPGVDRRFERWMQVIGALLEVRGLPGFMQEEIDLEDEVNEDAAAFAELAWRMYRAQGGNWMKVKDLVALCRSSDPALPPLYQAELRGSTPERSFSRYVLSRWVGERVRITGVVGAEVLTVALRTDHDRKTKSTRFRLEVQEREESGGDRPESLAGIHGASPPLNADLAPCEAGMAGIEIVSPPVSPPSQTISEEAFKLVGGGGGDAGIEGCLERGVVGNNHSNKDIISGFNDLPTLSQGEARRAIPASPAIPATTASDLPLKAGAVLDPWEGGTL